MLQDTLFIFGLIILLLTIPAALSSIRRGGDSPGIPLMLFLVGGGLLVFAVLNKPGGYAIDDIPAVLERVITHYIP